MVGDLNLGACGGDLKRQRKGLSKKQREGRRSLFALSVPSASLIFDSHPQPGCRLGQA